MSRATSSRLFASDLRNLLRLRYPERSHSCFFEVKESTGSGDYRAADALVMGLWPSRGLTLEGFEIKVSRSDWLRELKDGAKAEAVARYCDKWWLCVSSESIVKDGELPATWGLLAATAKGDRLRVVREAETLTPEPVSRAFLAAICRRAYESISSSTALAAAREEGFRAGAASVSRTDDKWEKRFNDLQATVNEFERASGLYLSGYTGGKELGDLVRLVRSGGDEPYLRRLSQARKDLAQLVAQMDIVLSRPRPTIPSED